MRLTLWMLLVVTENGSLKHSSSCRSMRWPAEASFPSSSMSLRQRSSCRLVSFLLPYMPTARMNATPHFMEPQRAMA